MEWTKRAKAAGGKTLSVTRPLRRPAQNVPDTVKLWPPVVYVTV
jgi:hypothetical protein